MTGFAGWVFFLGFLLVLGLLVVAVVANDELTRENRRLRSLIHPATRKANRP